MDIELLTPERLAYWCDLIAVPPAATQDLADLAVRIRTDAILLQIFGDFHTKTALQGDWQREWMDLPFDPAVQEKFGAQASLFYLLAYLAALPITWQSYQRLGVGLEIFKDTMLDFRFYIEDYHDLHGQWGYAHFAWIWLHLTCELFRLGRLQYMLIPFRGGVTAFRRCKGEASGTNHGEKGMGSVPDASPLLLADPELPLRSDGCAHGVGLPNGDKIPVGADSWLPVFESTPQGWRGHPVNPRGFVEKAPVVLRAAEWEVILQRGDTILDLHIPRKDPLNAQTCGASYAQALEFFQRVFPDRPGKALFCHTWMFSPQLQQFLPPESNLVKFQREFYLYPHPGGVNFLWNFVFGAKYPDRATAPRDTALRRAVLDWLETGGEIFDLPGVMFHAPAEWGVQPYMRRWEATPPPPTICPIAQSPIP